MIYRVVPLRSSFMVTSILGFFISIMLIYTDCTNRIGVNLDSCHLRNGFAFSFATIFVIMFVASIISMVHAPDAGFSNNIKIKKR